ncbi:hypothetical protein [Vibrio coralliirubri]|uniref:hypothetical protein n=1 Tax=Vibrio coralliirubri TaxID=1516159 RepID=UPI000A3B7D86|nr:hypothetical protein [Vibrio coralliirubri]
MKKLLVLLVIATVFTMVRNEVKQLDHEPQSSFSQSFLEDLNQDLKTQFTGKRIDQFTTVKSYEATKVQDSEAYLGHMVMSIDMDFSKLLNTGLVDRENYKAMLCEQLAGLTKDEMAAMEKLKSKTTIDSVAISLTHEFTDGVAITVQKEL